MAKLSYAFQGYDEKNMARALGRSLAISTKKSIETTKWIKGKSTDKAIKMLEGVIALKVAVPYTRFNQELAHQKATGPGGFPVTVAKEILAVLKSAIANAGAKGLDTENLKIEHICAHLASRPYHYGRQRRVKAKRSHIEIVVKEAEEKAKSAKKASSKPAKKPEVKAEKAPAKKVEAKAETKEAPAKEEAKVEAKSEEKTEAKEKAPKEE